MKMKATGKTGASMIGGVRSPMATSGHGLVAKGPMHPAGTDISRKKSMSGGTKVSSPYNKRGIV
jgi:hypothetical protein